MIVKINYFVLVCLLVLSCISINEKEQLKIYVNKEGHQMKQQKETSKIQEAGVIIMNHNNFQIILKTFQNLVVYFEAGEELKCQYCAQFGLTYALLAEHHFKIYQTQNQPQQYKSINFGKLTLTPDTQAIFKRFNIQQSPEIRVFIKGLLTYYEFKSLEYDDIIIEQIQEWIHRIIMVENNDKQIINNNKILTLNKMKQRSIKEDQIKYKRDIIVYQCDYVDKDENFKIFLKSIYIQNLDKQFFCLENINNDKNSKIDDEKRVLKIYRIRQKDQQNREFQTQNFDLNQQYTINLSAPLKYTLATPKNMIETLSQYHSHFNRYLCRYVQNWTLKSIQKVFVQHQSAFILLKNNQSRSDEILQAYRNLKKEININETLISPPFYVSDLSVTPQQTTKIKRYIMGVEMGTSKSYLYPVLAYLKFQGQKVIKYLFPMNRILTQNQMRNWVIDIIYKFELSHAEDKEYNELSNFKIEQYFFSTPQSAFPDVDDPVEWSAEHFQAKKTMELINFEDFTLMLAPQYKAEFFVYVNWRNDIMSYKLLNDLRKWWIPVSKKGKSQIKQDIHKQKKQQKQQVNLMNKQQLDLMNKQQLNVLNKQQLNVLNKNDQSWKNKQKDKVDNKYSNFVNIWILNLNINDYPRNYKDIKGDLHEINIEYIPTMLYFSKDKIKMDKIEGIFNLQQIKNFIDKNINIFIYQQYKQKQ